MWIQREAGQKTQPQNQAVVVEAPGIEPGAGSTQPPDLISQSRLAECGSNVDPAAEDRGPTLSRPRRAARRAREDWRSRITIELGRRGGRPCIRGLRITVGDVLAYLASGMSEDEILRVFPDLERDDGRASRASPAGSASRAGARRAPASQLVVDPLREQRHALGDAKAAYLATTARSGGAGAPQ
jgi:uncharacterized protein (DUF433 family)